MFSPAELAEWREWLVAHGAPARVLAELERFGDPSLRVVATGQQPGAAGGPLLTLYKALAAIAWARRHERETGIPTAAVFWVASDDHDLAEVRTATWLGADDSVVRVPLSGNEPSGRPVSHEPIDRALAERLIADLEATTPATEFRPALLDGLREAMLHSGATFESSFVRLILRWLGPLGIVPMVPRLAMFRRRAGAVIERELQTAPQGTSLVLEASGLMRSVGMEPPVHRDGNEANVFLHHEGRRCRLVVEGDAFHVYTTAGGKQLLKTLGREDLLARVREDAGAFSPNALLRPVVQDAILPTVAYVAGPREFVYHGQISRLYGEFQVARPAVLPRPRLALLEPKVARALEKLGLDMRTAGVESAEELEQAIHALRQDGPEGELLERLQAYQAQTEQLEKAIREASRDTGVRKAAEKLRQSVEAAAEKLRERLQAQGLARNEDRARAAGRLVAHLFPAGHLQEREIGALAPLLAQHGGGILARLVDVMALEDLSIQPISVAEGQR